MEFDKRTEKNLLTLDPVAQVKFRPFIESAKAYAASKGYEYIAISGNRTWEEQDKLYSQGRNGNPGKFVTKARGGYSNHNFKIALDFGVFKDGKYLDETHPAVADKIHKEIAPLAGPDIEWGGSWKSFKDMPHFEIKTGMTIEQKRKAFLKKGSIF